MPQTWLTIALVIKHFDAQGGKTTSQNFDEKQKLTKDDEAAWHEFFQIVKIHIIIRGEVYSVADLRKIYKEIRSERNLSSFTRNIDIRQKLQDMFYEKNVFKKMSSSKTEFVMSKETEKFVDISDIQLMSSLPSSLTYKRLEKMINTSIKSTLTDKPWLSTPEDIILTKYNINNDSFNLICWIIYLCGQLDDTGMVKLPKSKAEKVIQKCQNIECLLPKTKPSLDQALLSLTMHRKTGSSDVIQTLHKLGYGISYTETLFIKDKWAEWAESQSTIIPSNIKKNIPTIHVADNIDWENKSVTGQTHNTNSILILHINDNEARNSSIQLEPDYEYDRK